MVNTYINTDLGGKNGKYPGYIPEGFTLSPFYTQHRVRSLQFQAFSNANKQCGDIKM